MGGWLEWWKSESLTRKKRRVAQFMTVPHQCTVVMCSKEPGCVRFKARFLALR